MRDRKNLKWKPFNAVVPSYKLRNQRPLKVPSLSQSEISEFEEILKVSLYTGEEISITYIKNNKKVTENKTVKKINSVNKNLYFTDSSFINFRQVYKIEKK